MLMDCDHARDGAEDEDSSDKHPITDHHGAGFVAPETADHVAHGSSFPLQHFLTAGRGESWER
jgi:hypothetical protein